MASLKIFRILLTISLVLTTVVVCQDFGPLLDESTIGYEELEANGREELLPDSEEKNKTLNSVVDEKSDVFTNEANKLAKDLSLAEEDLIKGTTTKTQDQPIIKENEEESYVTAEPWSDQTTQLIQDISSIFGTEFSAEITNGEEDISAVNSEEDVDSIFGSTEPPHRTTSVASTPNQPKEEGTTTPSSQFQMEGKDDSTIKIEILNKTELLSEVGTNSTSSPDDDSSSTIRIHILANGSLDDVTIGEEEDPVNTATASKDTTLDEEGDDTEASQNIPSQESIASTEEYDYTDETTMADTNHEVSTDSIQILNEEIEESATTSSKFEELTTPSSWSNLETAQTLVDSVPIEISTQSEETFEEDQVFAESQTLETVRGTETTMAIDRTPSINLEEDLNKETTAKIEDISTLSLETTHFDTEGTSSIGSTPTQPTGITMSFEPTQLNEETTTSVLNESTEITKSSESTQSTETTMSFEPTQPLEVTMSSVSIQHNDLTTASEPTPSTDITMTSESIESTDITPSSGFTQTIETTIFSKLKDSTDTTTTFEPTDPTDGRINFESTQNIEFTMSSEPSLNTESTLSFQNTEVASSFEPTQEATEEIDSTGEESIEEDEPVEEDSTERIESNEEDPIEEINSTEEVTDEMEPTEDTTEEIKLGEEDDTNGDKIESTEEESTTTNLLETVPTENIPSGDVQEIEHVVLNNILETIYTEEPEILEEATRSKEDRLDEATIVTTQSGTIASEDSNKHSEDYTSSGTDTPSKTDEVFKFSQDNLEKDVIEATTSSEDEELKQILDLNENYDDDNSKNGSLSEEMPIFNITIETDPTNEEKMVEIKEDSRTNSARKLKFGDEARIGTTIVPEKVHEHILVSNDIPDDEYTPEANGDADKDKDEDKNYEEDDNSDLEKYIVPRKDFEKSENEQDSKTNTHFEEINEDLNDYDDESEDEDKADRGEDIYGEENKIVVIVSSNKNLETTESLETTPVVTESKLFEDDNSTVAVPLDEDEDDYESLLQENNLNTVEDEDGQFVFGKVVDHDGKMCMMANMTLKVRINDTNLHIPSNAKLVGSCLKDQNLIQISWKPSNESTQNNSVTLMVKIGEGNTNIINDVYINITDTNEKNTSKVLSFSKSDLKLDHDEAEDVDREEIINFDNGVALKISKMFVVVPDSTSFVSTGAKTIDDSKNALATISLVIGGIGVASLMIVIVGFVIYKKLRKNVFKLSTVE